MFLFTIPTILWILNQIGDITQLAGITNNEINYMAMLNKLSIMIFVPLIIAKILKRVIFRRYINRFNIPDYYNVAILILLYFMISIAIGFQADIIKQTWQHLYIDIIYLFMGFIVFQFIGYFSLIWLKKGDKIASANSTMIMNNVLGIVLALLFFGSNPKIVIINIKI